MKLKAEDIIEFIEQTRERALEIANDESRPRIVRNPFKHRAALYQTLLNDIEAMEKEKEKGDE